MTGSAGTNGAVSMVLAAVGSVFALVVLGAAAATNVVGLTAGSPAAGPAGSSAPSRRALDTIPAPMLALYRQAAPSCPGLDWSVLAGIGSVETDHGRSRLPGVSSGENSAGAAGPMQFLAATFAAVIADHPPPPGGARPPSRYNPHDAVHAAASYLCDSGAGSGRLRRALWAYNHSDAYVDDVLARAAAYRDPTTPATPGTGHRAAPGTAPGAAAGAGVESGAVRTSGWLPETATVPDPTVDGGRLTPRMHTLYRALDASGATRSGATCWDRHAWNPTSDHPLGKACDLFFTATDPADVARGWQIARYLAAAQAGYGIRNIIWQGQIWTADTATWRPYTSDVYGCPDPTNVTGCHFDHIHISVY